MVKNMEDDKCWECGGKMVNKKVDYSLYGISLGKFSAQVCDKCNETYFSEETSREITKIAKEKGLWKLETKTKIGKVGDALDVRFNKRLIEFLGLKKGEEVTIYPESRKRVIIEV